MRFPDIDRRTFLGGLGAAALGVSVASCSGGPKSSGGSSTTGVASTKPVLIGHQCDLTGALAATGRWRKKAVDAAVKKVNTEGGIAGRKVHVFTVDTQTDVNTGVRVLRKLIEEDGVDFVLGSEHGGIAGASVPITTQLRTLYLSFSRTDSLTQKQATPYVYRIMGTDLSASEAMAGWMVSNVGKTWSVVYADYAWGDAWRSDWASRVTKAGGRVLESIPMPVDTQDQVPYLEKVNRNADATFIAVLSPDVARAIPTANQLGLQKKPIVLATALLGTVDIAGLGKQIEGVWGSDTVPYALKDHDTPAARTMRSAVGINAQGEGIGSGVTAMMGDVWVAWEYIGWLKKTVEGSGWKGKSDTQKLIDYTNRHTTFKEGMWFPQGDLYVRPQDHQGFMDYYALRVENGVIRVKARVPRQKTIWPAVANVTVS